MLRYGNRLEGTTPRSATSPHGVTFQKSKAEQSPSREPQSFHILVVTFITSFCWNVTPSKVQGRQFVSCLYFLYSNLGVMTPGPRERAHIPYYKTIRSPSDCMEQNPAWETDGWGQKSSVSWRRVHQYSDISKSPIVFRFFEPCIVICVCVCMGRVAQWV